MLRFAIDFVLELGKLLILGLPLFIVLLAAIMVLSIWIGKKENWSVSDSLYYGLITATTVGYGDFHPKNTKCKFVAIAITLLGLILTGIVVAISVEALKIVVDARSVKL